MGPAAPSRKTFRFAAFEVDLVSGELRKQGLRIRLQEQPFAVLEALLEQPGEVVTREELVRRLWPDGTVVDFDRGLNAAVTRLRQALSDSAETPRYVETVARRGYRFIGTLATAPEAEVSPKPAPPARTRYLAAAGLSVAALAVLGLWLGVNASRPADGEWKVVPLTAEPGYESHASFSPDGTQVTYEWWKEGEPPHIYLKLVGPGDPIRLTSSPEPEYGPAWSPDGRNIAFLRRIEGETCALILIPALGGVERKLAEGVVVSPYPRAGMVRHLDWTTDSKHLVVSGPERPGDPARLFLVSIETREKRWLMDRPSVLPLEEERDPAVSPDGRTIAFVRDEMTGTRRIYLLPVLPDWRPAGQPRELATGGSDRNPAWTPDGKGILFKPVGRFNGELAAIGLRAGDKARSLPGLGTQLALPKFSRTGRLVFSRGSSDTNVWRQELVEGAGPSPPPVALIATTFTDMNAQYSPDGARIVLQSDRSGRAEIWVCASDGSHCAQVTNFKGPFVVGSPRWSPDGSRIAFDSAATGRFHVYTVDANGGPATRLIDSAMLGVIPSWSRDGRWIYFMSTKSGRAEIWKVPGGGGDATQVTKNGGYVALESAHGALYYTKTENDATLWRSGLDGSGEREVLRGVASRGFAFGRDWIYYLRAEAGGGAAIRRYSMANGADTEAAKIPRQLALGLSLSPDERFLLYTRFDQQGSDLMLVDGFR